MIYEDIDLSGSLDISGSWIVPTGTTEERPSSPLTGSLFYDTTEDRLLEWTGEWSVVGTQTQPPFTASADIEYLVVAGGGTGGAANGGGGGAGGLLSSSLSSIESGSSITVTVGAGGSGVSHPSVGNDGGNSLIASSTGTSFTTITSIGGGGGGKGGVAGRPGGSGGGGSYGATDSSYDGGAGTSGQGFAGGNARYTSQANWAGAGGGGASEVGGDASAGSTGGDGGDGKQSSITGTATYYAGGGGGGAEGAAGGAAGLGGASAGQNVNNGTSAAATANTGGGSGGGPGYPSAAAGNGGSGVVILAYDSGSINGAGGIVGDAGSGRKYHQFNTSGTFKAGTTSDFGIVTSSLVAHYDAGNYSSRGTSTWTDLEGSYNGTVSGATLGGNFYYDFDGSNDGITNTSITTTTNFTVEIWIKFNTIGSGQLEFIDFGDNGGSNLRMNTYNSSQIRFANRSNQTYVSSITTGQWYHLALSSDGSTATPYVDTTSQTTYVEPGLSGTFDGLYIGRNVDGNRFSDCEIAQLRIYSTNLSASEISQNYNATKTNFV